jgi:RsmE family RNA methyltransferase
MKRLLPQLASLGVRRIFLVGAEKVEKAFWGAQLLKEEIYRPLLVDGLQQAGTTQLPTIHVSKSFAYLMKRNFDSAFDGQSIRIVAHPYASGTSSQARHTVFVQGRIPVLAVGPEGGWIDAELALLEEKGFERMSLGPRILRTDTALVALLGILMSLKLH